MARISTNAPVDVAMSEMGMAACKPIKGPWNSAPMEIPWIKRKRQASYFGDFALSNVIKPMPTVHNPQDAQRSHFHLPVLETI